MPWDSLGWLISIGIKNFSLLLVRVTKAFLIKNIDSKFFNGAIAYKGYTVVTNRCFPMYTYSFPPPNP